jgi:predicted enzyme related to lactoylglutathione lyase
MVVVPVTDVDRAAAFYERLLGAAKHRLPGGRCHFDLGGVTLSCKMADGALNTPNSQYLYFLVDDLAESLKLARHAGALEVEEIRESVADERLFYAKDPFGNPICLVQRGTEYDG